jgi:ABC-2 type transport system ATP-binding protein
VLAQTWLHVGAGEAVGLVGANGAGKTTLLRIAAGLVQPDDGAVRWFDPAPRMRYFGGEMTLPPGVRASRWGALFGVPNDDRRRLGELSRGTRQLFGLRIVLANSGADVILLDEPWEGLDPAGSAWLTSAIQRWRTAGAGLLISSHRLHDLDACCTRFVMLRDGRCQPVAHEAAQARVGQLVQAFQRSTR